MGLFIVSFEGGDEPWSHREIMAIRAKTAEEAINDAKRTMSDELDIPNPEIYSIRIISDDV